MPTSHLDDADAFLAGDGTTLRELLHPTRHDVPIRYSLAHATLRGHHASLPHRLVSTEVYYVLRGEGVMHVDDETSPVRAGSVVVIPPGARQWIENVQQGPLVFLCIVDPPWRAQDETVEDDPGTAA